MTWLYKAISCAINTNKSTPLNITVFITLSLYQNYTTSKVLNITQFEWFLASYQWCSTVCQCPQRKRGILPPTSSQNVLTSIKRPCIIFAHSNNTNNRFWESTYSSSLWITYVTLFYNILFLAFFTWNFAPPKIVHREWLPPGIPRYTTDGNTGNRLGNQDIGLTGWKG